MIVTTATDGGASCHVVCLDASKGTVAWDREVFRQELRRKQDKNSYASSTPATDGAKIYAVFGSGGMAAVSMDGHVEWTRLGLKFHGQHGLGTSPVLHDDILIVALDGSSDGPDPKLGWQKPWDQSFVLALEKSTGKEKWKGMRGLSRIAHATPIVIDVGGKPQLLSNAGDVVQGFDLATGVRLWSVSSPGEGMVPSTAWGDGLAFTASGFEKPTIRAVRPAPPEHPDEAKIAWEQSKGVPMISSFTYKPPYLYSVTTNGVAMCLKGASGEIVWQERIGGDHSASPVWADEKIYFLAENGECVVVESGPKFKLLARNNLDEKFQASIAVSGGALFLKSERSLFCVRKP